jgi:transcriptional regulator with GAF, ATPase, and Fis domain
VVPQKSATPPVSIWPEIARNQSDPQAARATAEILWEASRLRDVAAFVAAALRSTLDATGGESAALATISGGRWTALGEAGVATTLPIHLLAEVLDREGPVSQASWMAAPLRPRAAGGEVLIIHSATIPFPSRLTTAVETLTPILGQALETVRQRDREGQRLRRLEAILQIAGQWYQTHEMEPLLEQMARAATALLHADRASIFLWDRPNHTLVGRPALGVPGNELRIPDNAGIVGQVVQLGEPRRVDLDRDQSLINRRVDANLGYQTRTLLCVPLRSRDGELLGAFETINKLSGNFTDDDEAALTELAAHAAVALENTKEREALLEARRQLTDQAAQGVQLVGQSQAIEALRSTIRRVADTELAILILGENGTGKEVVSQSIHYFSSRRDHPFIAVNCAALTETLLESELFGHEKGAFTDAHESRQGKFELASGGTLFLDEIGDLSAGGQAKLLRVLEEKVVVRVGGSKSIHTDARVIAATNQNLAEMVRQKRFRQDLYYRLNVVTLVLPPLRERPDDVLLLGEHFLHDFCLKARRKPPKITAAARRRLEAHTWPGNVRELRNLMERIAYLVPGDQIEADDLAFILSPAADTPGSIAPDLELTEATNRFQTEYIQNAIRRAGGNMSKAAERLGLHRSNLYRKMRQLGMAGEE